MLGAWKGGGPWIQMKIVKAQRSIGPPSLALRASAAAHAVNQRRTMSESCIFERVGAASVPCHDRSR
jgi:hypothetical protein